MATTKKTSLKPPVRPAPSRGFVREQKNPAALACVGAQAGAGPLSKGKEGPHAAAPGGADAGTRVREADDIALVVAAWSKLSAADRKRALAQMSLAQQRDLGKGGGDADLWSEAVYEALAAAIGQSDGSAHGPQVVRRVMGAPAAWGPVAEFAESARLDRLKPAERYSVFRLLARLLVARAKRVCSRADIPLTPKLVASNAVHLAGIFDNAFPGYLAAGLAGVVAKQLTSGNESIAKGALRRDSEAE